MAPATTPAPAAAVPASPVTPSAPAVKPVTSLASAPTKVTASPTSSPAQPKVVAAISSSQAGRGAECPGTGIDQMETARMIAAGYKNPNGSPIIVCKL